MAALRHLFVYAYMMDASIDGSNRSEMAPIEHDSWVVVNIFLDFFVLGHPSVLCAQLSILTVSVSGSILHLHSQSVNNAGCSDLRSVHEKGMCALRVRMQCKSFDCLTDGLGTIAHAKGCGVRCKVNS